MTAVATNTVSVMRQIEEQYNKHIDEHVDKLVDSFNDIVKVAEIKDKDKFVVAQEGYQIESQAAQIVRSSEALLTLITDLKQHLLLNDTKTLTQLTATRSRVLTEQRDEIRRRVVRLRDELDVAIHEMERVCFRSLAV
ncbi:surfeit locus protein 5 subunit 22 of mediator complex-domain-containing protein [Jimgerdemannia flammicorona]|uniref:Surfeit locus protein 5 subunit 22 of mediator complex-domain-containing protein n=2 Tax=Jimgerdemannia flammicorona TaxID=994334 RepID=A0A433QY24_9FUNG|nr:surfeit locus protein 5 subunit 22 of mediator complex-domain-containing protein [Jimgerdemannia flammicorona]RUS34712.1 surfeit locus protein 5 subunit 22 of mediator complex-domain-containing protein [Jimgerdemannia flammicorona]